MKLTDFSALAAKGPVTVVFLQLSLFTSHVMDKFCVANPRKGSLWPDPRSSWRRSQFPHPQLTSGVHKKAADCNLSIDEFTKSVRRCHMFVVRIC